MRILQWAFPYLPTRGGREVFVNRLASDLKNRGHDLQIFGNERSKSSPFIEVEEGDIPIHRFNLELLKEPGASATFVQAVEYAEGIVRAFQPEIIHFHNPVETGSLLLIEVLKGLENCPKVVLTYHSLADRESLQNAAKIEYVQRFIDCVVLPSKHNFDMVKAFSSFAPEKLRLIYNGVPIPTLTNRTESTPPYFLYAGRLNSDKGVGILLSAMVLLRESHPEITLKVVGSGIMEKQLRDFCRLAQIESSVEFIGWLKEVELQALMRGSLAVVMPSTLSEPFGLIGAEAQALGVPLIASRTGGLSEIPVDSETGLLIPLGDFGLLAQAMRYMAENPESREIFGRAGAIRAAERFSLEKSHSAYENLYQELVAR